MIRGELRVALAGILALVTLVAFEAMAVATVMPVVARDLGGLRHYGLAFSLFLTTSLLGMVLAGTWNDVRGPLGPVLAGLVAFTGGLVLCGCARTFPVLLVGRAVSGAGGGVLVVTLYVVVGALFDEAVRPRVFAWLSSAWVLPALVGPPLAGVLAARVSWRAVFLLVAPLAVVVVALLVRPLTAQRPDRVPAAADEVAPPAGAGRPEAGSGRRRALAGLVLAVGATLAQTGAGQLSPLRPLPVLAVAVGLAALAASLPRLLPAGTLRLRRGLPSVVAARGLFTAAFMGAEAYVPYLLVVQRHLSPTQGGLSLTGGALGWAAGSTLLGLRGRGAVRAPRHRVMVVGGLLVATGVALLVPSSLGGPPPGLVVAIWTLAGLGMGLGLTSTSVLVLAMAPEAEHGRASSALQLSDALGSVVGIGVAGAVLAAHPGAGGHQGGALAGVFAGLAAVGLLAAVASARIPTADRADGPPADGPRDRSGDERGDRSTAPLPRAAARDARERPRRTTASVTVGEP